VFVIFAEEVNETISINQNLSVQQCGVVIKIIIDAVAFQTRDIVS
jgi:hypothetical protein